MMALFAFTIYSIFLLDKLQAQQAAVPFAEVLENTSIISGSFLWKQFPSKEECSSPPLGPPLDPLLGTDKYPDKILVAVFEYSGVSYRPNKVYAEKTGSNFDIFTGNGEITPVNWW